MLQSFSSSSWIGNHYRSWMHRDQPARANLLAQHVPHIRMIGMTHYLPAQKVVCRICLCHQIVRRGTECTPADQNFCFNSNLSELNKFRIKLSLMRGQVFPQLSYGTPWQLQPSTSRSRYLTCTVLGGCASAFFFSFVALWYYEPTLRARSKFVAYVDYRTEGR
jgi:hypothetical protein